MVRFLGDQPVEDGGDLRQAEERMLCASSA